MPRIVGTAERERALVANTPISPDQNLAAPTAFPHRSAPGSMPVAPYVLFDGRGGYVFVAKSSVDALLAPLTKAVRELQELVEGRRHPRAKRPILDAYTPTDVDRAAVRAVARRLGILREGK